MEIVIFMGIQASGKSTFYKKHFFRTHVRINLDMLRTRHRENIILDACFRAKQPCVIDNTNPTIEDRKKYITWAKQHDFRVIGYYFEPDYKGSVERNAQRIQDEQIPIIGLKSTLHKLHSPHYDEGFDKVYHVKMLDRTFSVERKS
ncbi:ATP-binding protein [Hazenella sp. IB182357]|uniref:ATP-binding protein n=1 Tax=Polycladospora coralii TaxID=2771432 RepID=A0A926N9N8_9BACL|nr:ATP-binding protein [Polycladospora coralii]MBD1371090.1 ATP-binding protein [Polycladospora coralii]